MPLLYFLIDMFINTFGITRPSEEAKRRAAFFILGLLTLTVAGAVLAFFVLHGAMR
jgi:hypothetical protein